MASAHLHGRDFVFGTVGGPVGKLGGDHVGAGHGVMERGVDHAGLHALGNARVQGDFSGAAGERNQIAIANAAVFGVEGMDFEHVLVVPDVIGGAARLRAHVVLRKNAPGGEDQRETAGGALVGGNELGDHEAALAANESADVHDRRAFRSLVIAGPLHAAEPVELFVADARESGSEPRDFVHDFRWMAVVHRIAERVRKAPR